MTDPDAMAGSALSMETGLCDSSGETTATSGTVSVMTAVGSLLLCTECISLWSSPEETGLASAVGSIMSTGIVGSSSLIEPAAGSRTVSTITAAGSLLLAINCAESPDPAAFGEDIISIGVILAGKATEGRDDGSSGKVCLIGSFSFFGCSGYGLGASGLIGTAGLLSRGRRRHLHLFTTTTVTGVIVGV